MTMYVRARAAAETRRLPSGTRRAFSTITDIAYIEHESPHADLARFRALAFTQAQPLVLKKSALAQSNLSARSKWFSSESGAGDGSRTSLSAWLRDTYSATMLPFELSPSMTDDIFQSFRQYLQSDETKDKRLRALVYACLPESQDASNVSLFQAPLELLCAAIDFNKSTSTPKLHGLYVAQASLQDLPDELGADLPTPRLVTQVGKGDVYDSSIWMGLEPTYTPWHRDPNPNLFCQLCSSKKIRMLPPIAGETIFRDVQAKLGRQGSSRIRDASMMGGTEKDMYHHAIWEDGTSGEIMETEVRPGDALFIPLGWWHSIKSSHADARLNASVNWWFR